MAIQPQTKEPEKRLKNAPTLRFPEFSGEWESATLENATKKKISYGIVQAGPHIPDGMPYIKSTDLNSPLNLNDLQRTSDDIANAYRRSEVEPGDIVFSLRGNIGVSQIVPNEIKVANLTQGTARIAVKQSFSNAFVLQTLKNIKTLRRVLAVSKGSTFQEISLSDLRKVSFFYPTPPEQEKIAAFLGVVDERVEQLRKKQELLEQYKKGVMQRIFSGQIRFKDDSGHPFPDWQEKKLGEVFIEVKDKVGSQNLETYSITAGVGFVSQKEKFGKDISGQQNENYTALKPDQFSYNKGNSKTYSYGCVYPNETGQTIGVPNVFISFAMRDKKMATTYFAKLFENHYLDKGLRKIISSGARMDGLLNVNKQYFFDLKIPIPHPDEQRKIADFLSAIDAKISAVADELAAAQAYKKSLLQQMFV